MIVDTGKSEIFRTGRQAGDRIPSSFEDFSLFCLRPKTD